MFHVKQSRPMFHVKHKETGDFHLKKTAFGVMISET